MRYTKNTTAALCLSIATVFTGCSNFYKRWLDNTRPGSINGAVVESAEKASGYGCELFPDTYTAVKVEGHENTFRFPYDAEIKKGDKVTGTGKLRRCGPLTSDFRVRDYSLE